MGSHAYSHCTATSLTFYADTELLEGGLSDVFAMLLISDPGTGYAVFVEGDQLPAFVLRNLAKQTRDHQRALKRAQQQRALRRAQRRALQPAQQPAQRRTLK